MTDAEFNAWLRNPNGIRTVLIEVEVRSGNSEITRYFSSGGYVTGAADTPANTVYKSVIAGGVNVTERITLEAAGNLSYGDIELHNETGELDSWFQDIWKNRAIRVFVGDKRWPRSDFRAIFNGLVADIDSRTGNRLNIRLGDKMQRLNAVLSDVKLGGLTINADRLIPYVFGEVHNITPLLIDPAQHQYKVHGGLIELIIEVRDEGVPVDFVADLATGTFKLLTKPLGTITASVQGSAAGGYTNRIAPLIRRIVTSYGPPNQRLTDADIDLANFSAFDAANPQPVGEFAAERMTTFDLCQRLANAVGAQLVISRAGLLRLVKIELPAPGSPFLVKPSDIEGDSLRPAARLPVIAAVKLGYCQNWTVQEVQTGIPTEHKDLFAREYLTVTKVDAEVAAAYRLLAEPVMQPVSLLTTEDAEAEALRRLNLQKVPRTIYTFTGYADMLNLKLGQALRLTHYRYNLQQGVTGMVVSITSNWMTQRTTVEVMV